jgi:guanyl-specific ribonuclease Sa
MTGGAYPKIPTISIADLYKCRPDARTMVKLIQSNGPFQYKHDDIVFNNREAILPSKPKGTYHEYTVETPGASNRGAHRLITAGRINRKAREYDQLYYTDDHYQTIWLVKE